SVVVDRYKDEPPSELSSLPLHDALPISPAPCRERAIHLANQRRLGGWDHDAHPRPRLRPVSNGDVAAPLSSRPDPLPFFQHGERDRKSTRLNSSHVAISYAVFSLKTFRR